MHAHTKYKTIFRAQRLDRLTVMCIAQLYTLQPLTDKEKTVCTDVAADKILYTNNLCLHWPV